MRALSWGSEGKTGQSGVTPQGQTGEAGSRPQQAAGSWYPFTLLSAFKCLETMPYLLSHGKDITWGFLVGHICVAVF